MSQKSLYNFFSSSSQHRDRSSEFERTRYVTSRHFAPPSLPPIPPPLDIPMPANAEEEIYAEINESPLTGTSVISSRDYEVGYILNVDSVPGKARKSFGQFNRIHSVHVPLMINLYRVQTYNIASNIPGPGPRAHRNGCRVH